MKFSSREDIEAPIGDVFEMLSDFNLYERSAMRRGADVRRTDGLASAGVGMSWAANFTMRGKRRKIDVQLTSYERPNTMVFDSTAKGVKAQLTIDLVALSLNRTRMAVGLGKARLTSRFKLRVAQFAKDLESRRAPAA
jgi:uncharacterized protein YndB with AHSA1/START domain